MGQQPIKRNYRSSLKKSGCPIRNGGSRKELETKNPAVCRHGGVFVFTAGSCGGVRD